MTDREPWWMAWLYDALGVAIWCGIALLAAWWENTTLPMWGIWLAVSAGVAVSERHRTDRALAALKDSANDR